MKRTLLSLIFAGSLLAQTTNVYFTPTGLYAVCKVIPDLFPGCGEVQEISYMLQVKATSNLTNAFKYTITGEELTTKLTITGVFLRNDNAAGYSYKVINPGIESNHWTITVEEEFTG